MRAPAGATKVYRPPGACWAALDCRAAERPQAEAEEKIGSEDDLRLLDERTAAKKAKDYARADEIRAELERRGYIVKDTPQGAVLQRRV